jgi:uncharacterized membrane protein
MTPLAPFGFDTILLVGFLVPAIVFVLFIGVMIWAIRRNAPIREDPAVAELKGRLARGEIDPVEYQVRMRALRDGDE